MNHHYCPLCCAEIPIGAEVCPACGRDIESWERNTPYFDRLLWALRNPHPEVRMGAILSVQYQGRSEAALPLAQCALQSDVDVVQGLAVVEALRQLPDGADKAKALELLREHPAHSIREAAQRTSLENAGSVGHRDSAEWKKRLGSILEEWALRKRSTFRPFCRLAQGEASGLT